MIQLLTIRMPDLVERRPCSKPDPSAIAASNFPDCDFAVNTLFGNGIKAIGSRMPCCTATLYPIEPVRPRLREPTRVHRNIAVWFLWCSKLISGFRVRRTGHDHCNERLCPARCHLNRAAENDPSCLGFLKYQLWLVASLLVQTRSARTILPVSKDSAARMSPLSLSD